MTQAAFLLFVFLKQFYIKSSGSVGIADLCMAFCVIFLVLDIVRGKRKMPSVTDLKREKFLIAFLICVVIINLFFTIKDRCLDYERYTLYWIFNGAAKMTGKQIDPYMLHWMTHMNTDSFVHLLTHETNEQSAMQHMQRIMDYLVKGWMELILTPVPDEK